MQKPPVWKPSPIFAALTVLAAAGMACTFLTPTPVAWSLTATPGAPAPAVPTAPAQASRLPTLPAPTPVTPAPGSSAPSPTPVQPGPWLVYSRDGGQPAAYDSTSGASTRVTSSAPARFAGDLSSGVSPAGGWLAFRSGQQDLADLALDLVGFPGGEVRAHLPLLSASVLKKLQAAGSGALPDAVAALAQPDGLSWSPDGRYLAYVGASDGPSSDLYLFDMATQKTRRLTDGLNQVAHQTWSPDGLWVIFQEVVSFSAPPGWKLGPVWAAATDHNELRKLYVPPANSTGEGFLGWSAPDMLVVYTQAADGLHDLRAIPISARFVDRLYGGPLDHAALDPASQTIAFTETDLTGAQLGLAPGIYRLPGLKGSPQFVQAGEWSSLAYAPRIGRFTAAGEQGLLLFSPQGDSLLLKGEAGASASPDGHWVACWGDRAHPGLRLYQPDGLLLQEVTAEPVSQVLWQPDSQAFYYVAVGKLFRVGFPQVQPALLDQGVDSGSLGWLARPAKGG